MNAHAPVAAAPLVDPFGRAISYLRVSVTDRCDYRCVYCMSEDMNFLPKRDILSLEELDRLCSAFIGLGARKIRITGGEPLVRRNVMSLFHGLSRHLATGALDEVTLTTNGSQLARFAHELADCGVERINVSLDTLDPLKFRQVTRWGELSVVLSGIDAASAAGLKIKINAVALKGFNDEEALSLVEWAHGRGFDVSFIEVMPLGEMERDRADQFLPLTELSRRLESRLASPLRPTQPGGRRATTMSRKPGDGSGSSPRSPIISARAAIGSGSPARARCTCVLAKRMRRICVSRCVARTPMRRCLRPSGRRSRASPRATISSSHERRRLPPSAT